MAIYIGDKLISGGVSADKLSDYYTKSEVDKKIENVAVGDVDLTSYASDLMLSGNKLQLKNKNGALIGSSIYLSLSGGSDSGLEFTNSNVVNSISASVNESIIGQEYLGGYIEIQPDSWDGSTVVTGDAKDGLTWGFPTSLLNSEQQRIKNELMHGNGSNIMFIRLPLGFAYRGYRNIDTSSGLAKNIGERFPGQNARLRLLLEDIAKAGGGLAPEYWCPAPYWLTGGAYYNASVPNRLTAGGSYSRTTLLSSIKTSDSTQYNKQINDFTNAIIDDLEYLHQNIAPVRMFGLQNEPQYGGHKYGACQYDKQTYNDVLEVLIPKIKASEILSKYNDEENEVKIHVGSSDEYPPFSGIASTFITNHSDLIWGYSHHSTRRASGEAGISTYGADWYKSSEFSALKGDKNNVFINEYEYFGAFTGDTNNYRCSNNMLRMINELVYGKAKVLHPVIHIWKPIGQTAAATNTKGYCLYPANMKGEYGVEIAASTNTDKLLKGTCSTNPTMYNSWALFANNLPVGSYVVGDYSSTINNAGWVTLKHGGKLYIFLANNGDTDVSISLTFSKEKTFSGKYYDTNYIDQKMKNKKGTTIEFVIPAYSGQCWIETKLREQVQQTEPSEPTEPTKTLQSISATYNQGSTKVYPDTAIDSLKTNLVVTAKYSDNSTNTVSGYTLSGTLTVGTSTVTVSYQGKTTTFDVTVSQQATLQSITATYNQGSTKVYPNSALDSLKSNLVVTANYSDGNNQTINDYELSGSLSIGTSTITVTYQELTTTFEVTVSEKEIASGELTTNSLIFHVQAEENAIQTNNGSIYYMVDKSDGTHYGGTSMSASLYNADKKSFVFSQTTKAAFAKKPTVGTSFSLETMIRTETLIKTTTKFAIINFNSSSNLDGVGFVCRTGNIFEASYRVKGETVPIQHTLDTNSTWTHAVAVVDVDNKQLSFYVNGSLISSSSFNGVYSAVNPITINESSFSSNYDINMIRLYDKALTSTEVESNYNYQQTLI